MRQKIITVLGILILFGMVVASPWSRESSDFGQILGTWGQRQEEYSSQLTDEAVSGLEGDIVGEHQINGANWSIPNIIRHWLGVR